MVLRLGDVGLVYNFTSLPVSRNIGLYLPVRSDISLLATYVKEL